jgi:hypothetical protein
VEKNCDKKEELIATKERKERKKRNTKKLKDDALLVDVLCSVV